MMCKSFFASKPALALAAILAVGSLSLGTDAFAARGGGGGGGHGGGGGGHGGGGGGYHGGGGGGGGYHGAGGGGGGATGVGGGVRSGLGIRSGGARPGVALRRGTQPGAALRSAGARPSVALRSSGLKVGHGVRFHRRFVHRRFRLHVFPYYTYGCYRWRRVLTPFGWRLRRVNVCDPYYRQYYY